MPRSTSKQKQQAAPMVLVAGGAGFLGSHLCESLLNTGATVLAVDDLVTGAMANIEPFKRHPHFEFFECNVNQGLPASLFEKPITHIVQTIGAESHAGDSELTLAGLLAGAFGTKNLLDLSVATGARFVLASSLYIYDGLASSASLIDYFGSKDAQEAQYSTNEAKRYSEALCELYVKEYNLDVRVGRLSHLYGPRMDLSGNSIITTLIRETVTGQDLHVAGESNQELLLTYVTDAVYGLSRLLFAEGDYYRQSIYPLANPEKVSIISIAYTLRSYLSPGKEINFSDSSGSLAMPLPKLSLERSRRELDWDPSVSLTEGLKQTIEYFKQNQNLPLSHKPSLEQLTTKPLPTNLNTTVAPPPAPAQSPSPADSSASLPKKWEDGLKFRGSVPQPAIPAKPEATTAEPSRPVISPTVKTPAAPAPQPPQAEQKIKVKPKSWWRKLLFGLAAIVLYLGLGRPLVHTTVLAAAGAIEMRQGLGQAKSLDLAMAHISFSRASELLDASHTAIQPLGWVATTLGQHATFIQIGQGFDAAVNASAGMSTLCQTSQPLVAELTSLAHFRHPDNQKVDLTSLSEQSLLGLHQAQSQIGQAIVAISGSGEARVAGANMTTGMEKIGQQGLLSEDLTHTRDLLIQAQAALTQAEPVIKALPDLLGQDGVKTYLVMLENSNELRPTGGFMGSYAKIQVDNGKITNFTVDDIHNPDGQLHSRLTPPAAFTDAFGVTEQYLRDANWSPDAASSAQAVEALYKQATGQKVEGVGFVTTGAIRNLLASIGPIYLPSFNEKVTAQNFDTLAQVHSDVGFVPGSTAKKDFLGQLAEQMINRLEQGGPGAWLPLGKGLSQALTTKDIQLYTEDPNVQSILDSRDWSGRIKATAGDYVGVVDANLGSNKANYYVKRQTSYAVDVDRDSQLHGVLNITWTHSGTSGTWPGGDYKNYVRIYVPQGSRLTSASGFTSKQLDISEEQGKTVFGGFVTVPYHSQRSVVVKYDLPQELGLTVQNGAYQLVWQKQAGISDEPLSVTFNTPVFLQATSMSGNGKMINGSVVWQTNASTDQLFKLTTNRSI